MTPPNIDPDVAELQRLVQQLVQGIRQSVDAVPNAGLRDDLRHIAATLEEANAGLLSEHEQAQAEIAAMLSQIAQPLESQLAPPEDVLALGRTLRDQLLDRYARKAPTADPLATGHGNVWSQLEGVTTVPPEAGPGLPSYPPAPVPPADHPGSVWGQLDDLTDPPGKPKEPKPDQKGAGQPPENWEKTSQIEGF